jgi:hypothetical protein
LSAYAWVLGRALQYAAATAVIALAVSTISSGADTERFATAAYLAAIIAAVILALAWFARDARPLERTHGPIFPATFVFFVWVAAFLFAGTTLASQPGAEVRAVVACFGLIGAAALVRGGALAALHARLTAGGRRSAVTRYAVVITVVALGAGALVGSAESDGFTKLAYAAAVVAAATITASLIAPTPAGARLIEFYRQAAARWATPAGAFVFARTADYAVATAIAALLLAGLLPQPYAEPFASTAYLAAFFAALGIGMRWRLRGVAIEPVIRAERASNERVKFAATVAVLLVAGAGLALNSIAEEVAIAVCLCVIWAAIAKRSRSTTAP